MEYFYSWPEAFEYLRDLIDSRQPVSGRGIVVENTPSGARINQVDVPVGGNPGYIGPFQVGGHITEDGGICLTVTSHGNSSAVYCGSVFCGGSRIDVPFFKTVPSGAGYIQLIIRNTAAAGKTPVYAAEIFLDPYINPEFDSASNIWTKIVIIGSYKVKEPENEGDSPVLSTTQIWMDGNIIVSDRCV